jgi:hypothetical protein
MRVHLTSEHLVGVTLLDCFNIIFKNRQPKITGTQYFLGSHKPRYMTTTSRTVTVIKNRLNLLVSQETTQDIIYVSEIQSVIDDKVVLNLISYTPSIISRKVLRELQGFKIDQNVSIPRV